MVVCIIFKHKLREISSHDDMFAIFLHLGLCCVTSYLLFTGSKGLFVHLWSTIEVYITYTNEWILR
jgi:hypothetical protein